MEITFLHSIYLWVLLIIPVLIVLYFISVRYSKAMTLKFANFIALSRVLGNVGELSQVTLLIVRMLALSFIILSISGMTLWYIGETSYIDYTLAIDSSASMMSNDFYPTRLDAAKTAATNFVDSIPIDSNVGVLSFSGVSFIDQPLTQQKVSAKEAIANIKAKTVGGTDFGNAIITATNILLPSKKAKVIVLLTDGRSNIGVSEATAINYAIQNHVIVDTIGIGSVTEDTTSLELGVDEESLKRIANSTSGSYYLVTNPDELNRVYDHLVKTKHIGNNPVELSFILLMLSLVLLLSDWLLGNTIYRRIP